MANFVDKDSISSPPTRQALVNFLDAVKDGLSIADCISRVQDQVLQKVSQS